MPVDSVAIVETVLCMVTAKPMECAQKHAGRMLNNLDSIVDYKRKELSGKVTSYNHHSNLQMTIKSIV